MQQVADQDGARVDVQDLADAVLGVIVEEFIQPFQYIIIRLPHTAEVAGDGLRSAQVQIRAVRALGIQGFDIAGADDLHGSSDRRQVAILLLLFHLAHTDITTRHELALLNGAFSNHTQPGEILKRTDLQGDGEIVCKADLIRFLPQHRAAVIFDADECAALGLRLKPFQIRQVFRFDSPDALQQSGHLARRIGFAIDLFRRAVPGDHLHEIIDHTFIRVEQERVNFIQMCVGNLQSLP